MRDYLIWQGITEIRGSRDAIRLAFKYGLIDNAETWMKMVNARNLTSHTYSERLVQELLREIVEVFYDELEKLLNKFLSLEKESK